MRELLLIFIVGCASLTGLFRPLIGLYGYIWFAVMRPDVFAWSTDRQYSLVLAVATLLGCVPYLGQVLRLFASSISRWLLVLQVIIGLSVLFAVKPELCYDNYWVFVRIILMALLIPVLVLTVEDLRYLLLLMALSIGVVGSKFGFWALLQGGVHFTVGLGGFMSDNNNLALALVMGIPLLYYGRRLTESRNLRMLLLVMLFGTTSAVIMSHSRGGALALGAVILMVMYRSKKSFGSSIGILLMIALLLVPPLYLVRETYFDRLSTIKAPSEESSALSRLAYASAAFRMWQDYPLFGVGFGTENQMRLWPQYVDEQFRDKAQVVHNTYLQMLADSGMFAFLIHTLLLWGSVLAMGRSATRLDRQGRADLATYPLLLQASLAGFGVGSLFLSRVMFDFYYLLLMCAASWQIIERTLAEETLDGEETASVEGADQDSMALAARS